MLELLDALDDARGGRRRRARCPASRGLLGDRAAAGELGDEHVAAVADERRVDVLERRRVGADAGGVQARLVREGVLADVGLRRVGRAVEQLVDEVRGLGEPRELLGLEHLRRPSSAAGRR